MSDVQEQLPDGRWVDSEPIPMQGLGRVEQWCNNHHLRPIGRLLGWIDELGLG